jgi:HK97 family phage major capsid protein
MASSNGGDLVPTDTYAAEVIDALRPRTVVRKHVPAESVLPMEHGNLFIGRANGSATIGWIGESQQTAISAPSFGEIALQAKKATAAIPVSNSLLRFAAPELERVVSDQVIRQYAAIEDAAFLRGVGSQWTPKGLRYSAATVNTATLSYNVTTVLSDVQGLVSALENANVPMTNPVFFTSPKVKEYLLTATAAGSGNLMFPSVGEGRLLGYPIEVTTSIPANLGGSSNQSEVYLCDMAEAIIGMSYLDVNVRNTGTYHDAGGNLISAFDRDESIVRVIGGVDFALRHSASAAVLTAVPWGN